VSMASWKKIVSGDTLYDVRRQRTGLRSELCVWPVKVISMDSVTEMAVCSWNGNRPTTWKNSAPRDLEASRES
jgi:hypothetical protein